jgi:hypothetical protein
MLDDGAVYYQPCYYCKNAVETIISPQAILTASDVLIHWTQTGHKDGSPGTIRFDSDSSLLSFTMTLENKDGLYYCPTDAFTVAQDPVRCNVPLIRCAIVPPPPVKRRHKSYNPVSRNCITELELWMLRLGSPGEDQLNLMSGRVTGLPPEFKYHAFWHIDWKEEARVQKQKALKLAERTMDTSQCFYMDFGFMRASSSDYNGHRKSNDRVVSSWDGFSSYPLVVDEASRHV